jgi:hypothetical protein
MQHIHSRFRSHTAYYNRNFNFNKNPLHIEYIYIKENATCLSLYVSKPNQNAFVGRFRIASDAILLWVSVLDMRHQTVSHKQYYAVTQVVKSP